MHSESSVNSVYEVLKSATITEIQMFLSGLCSYSCTLHVRRIVPFPSKGGPRGPAGILTYSKVSL